MLNINTPARGTNAGGIEYDGNMYRASFYSIMMHPSGLLINGKGGLRKATDNIFPKIVSGRWKKCEMTSAFLF